MVGGEEYLVLPSCQGGDPKGYEVAECNQAPTSDNPFELLNIYMGGKGVSCNPSWLQIHYVNWVSLFLRVGAASWVLGSKACVTRPNSKPLLYVEENFIALLPRWP